MSDPSRRVLVIGLDMGDGRLIRNWSKAGKLPNLSRLIDAGTWLDLESTAAVLHTSTWPTFATGDLPGRHGVYYPYQPSPGHQEAQLIKPDQYGSTTFWSRADRAGRRCVVYDVPETFPEADFGGRGIFEWGVWAWYGERLSQPATLLAELKKRFGNYPLKMEAKRLGLRFPEPHVLRPRLLESVDHKRRSLQWLMGEDRWDLAVMVFGETHPAGHYLFPASEEGPPDPADGEFDAIRSVYESIDEALGELTEALPEDVTLLAVSGDGVRPNHCGWHLLPEVMDRLGYSGAPSDKPGTDEAPRKGLLGQAKDLVPKNARRWIADHLPWWLRDLIGARIRSSGVDWSTTRAFALPTDLEGVIRINLRGREPAGIVEPGEDYRQLCSEIADRLRELVNPDTGEQAVSQIWIRDEVFPGPKQEDLPDMMVAWNDSAPIRALTSPRIGTVEQDSPDPRTGTHSTEGFLLAVGAPFGAGIQGEGRLVDVAATVLELMNVSHEGMDGEPLAGAKQNAGSRPSEQVTETTPGLVEES